jgi:hypothetical protein
MANWEANWNRDMLERTVALLFALANLADLAAGASFLRRRQALGILSYGEAEARAFVIGISTGAPVSADALEQAHDAARLVASFRALALLLCAMLARRFAFALPGMAGPRADRSSHRISGRMGRHAAPSAPDTS